MVLCVAVRLTGVAASSWRFQSIAPCGIMRRLSGRDFSMFDTRRLSPTVRSRFILLFGLMLSITGAMGTIALSMMLLYILPKVASGDMPFFGGQALFQTMWAVFFISLFMTGVSLMISAARRKQRDLVPGLTLYFLGAALVINGLLLMTYAHFVFGLAAMAAGSLAIYLEWSIEVV